MNDDRGSWYLLTAILLGIGLGLLYSWVVSPAEFIDTPPVSLRSDFKDGYRAAIAAAYVATGNIQRAQARLNLLGDDDPSLALVAQAQNYLAEGDGYGDAQALAKLASALGQAPTPQPTQPESTPTKVASNTATVVDSPTPTPTLPLTLTSTPSKAITLTDTIPATQDGTSIPSQTPTITRTPPPTQTPTHTYTPTPTRTPTPTLAPPFVLDNQVEVCNPILGEPQLQVFVSNAAGVGIPGVEIVVIWVSAEEHFYTGLKPDIDIGYADFVMTPEVFYTLRVADGGQLISNLTAPPCTDENGDPYWGSLRLVFSHP
jgi:hypothetical protein